MPTSGIIYLAIGMVLTFAVTSAVSSAVTEGIARFLGLRGEFLLRGLYELLDGGRVTADLSHQQANYQAVKDFITVMGATPIGAKAVTSSQTVPSVTSALLGSPILRNLTRADLTLTLAPPRVSGNLPKLTASPSPPWRQYRTLPTYIPAASFADAVMDLVLPDVEGKTTLTVVMRNVNALPDAMTALKSSLQALAKNAGSDIDMFRTSVERWFNDQMDRVSHAYKRHITKIALMVGVVIVLLFNINALAIGRYLYSDNAVSTAVSNAAKSYVCPAGISEQDCLNIVRAQLSSAATAGLPIGWASITDCTEPNASCNWLDQRGVFSRHGSSGWEAVLFLIGFLLTIVALIPGARFWFNLLTKLGSVLGA